MSNNLKLNPRILELLRKNSPTMSDVYVSAPLTGMSVGYMQDQQDFLVNRLNAFIDVPKPTGQFFKHTKDDWFRSTAAKRAYGTQSAGGDYALTTGTYSCNAWGIHKDTPSEVLAAAESILKMDEKAMQYVTNQILLGMDIDLVDTLLKTSVWFADWTGAAADDGSLAVTYWNRDASKPIRDVRNIAKRIRTRTGKRANVGIFGSDVILALENNADIISRFPGSNEVMIDEAALAKHFKLDRVFVFDTAKNSANKGAAVSMADVFGKHAWIGYLDPNPGIDTATAFATHRCTALYGSQGGMQIKRFEMVAEDIVRVEAKAMWQHNAIATDCGEFLSGIVE